MIAQLMFEIAILGIVTKAEWNQLRTSKRVTKIVFFLLMGVSGTLWFYVVTAKHVIYPASYFSGFFKYLDPFA